MLGCSCRKPYLSRSLDVLSSVLNALTSQEKEVDPGGHVKVQFQVDPFFRKRSKDRSKALGSKAIATKEEEPLVCR